MKIPFKNLLYGARFKYPGTTDTWVMLQPYDNGLIARWDDSWESRAFQGLCSFVDEDEDITLDTEVEVVNDHQPLPGSVLPHGMAHEIVNWAERHEVAIAALDELEDIIKVYMGDQQ